MVAEVDKPIVLLGFMGSGKSTLGKQLATSPGWSFLDLDRFIESEENRTIPEIFEQDGETSFRKLESKALKKVLAYPHQVISIGGGAPCNPANLKLIKEKSLSVYLKISEPQLLQRLVYSSTPRPLLKGKSESEIQSYIADLLATREPFYLQADIIIESDEITVGMILSNVTPRLR
jgi:shikimate kinase